MGGEERAAVSAAGREGCGRRTAGGKAAAIEPGPVDSSASSGSAPGVPEDRDGLRLLRLLPPLLLADPDSACWSEPAELKRAGVPDVPPAARTGLAAWDWDARADIADRRGSSRNVEIAEKPDDRLELVPAEAARGKDEAAGPTDGEVPRA